MNKHKGTNAQKMRYRNNSNRIRETKSGHLPIHVEFIGSHYLRKRLKWQQTIFCFYVQSHDATHTETVHTHTFTRFRDQKWQTPSVEQTRTITQTQVHTKFMYTHLTIVEVDILVGTHTPVERTSVNLTAIQIGHRQDKNREINLWYGKRHRESSTKPAQLAAIWAQTSLGNTHQLANGM